MVAECRYAETGVGAAINKLPVNRWGESSTSFHYRLDADAWNDLAEKVQDQWPQEWKVVQHGGWMLCWREVAQR